MKFLSYQIIPLLVLLAVSPVLANFRNDHNLLGPTGLLVQPSKNGITKVEAGSPADGKIRPDDVILGAMLCDEKQDPEVRVTAASALAPLGESAFAYYHDMLKMVVEEEPGDPLGLSDESLAESLNTLCPDPFAAGQVKDKDLTYHSYHNPGQAIGSGIALFARFHIKEGLDYTLAIEESESGKGSFKMRTIMDSLARYGAHARPYVEKLQQRDEWKSVPNNRKFKSNWENMIKAMEADKTPGALISLEKAMSASGKK